MTEENKDLKVAEEVVEEAEEAEKDESRIDAALKEFKSSLEENLTRENLEARFDEFSQGIKNIYAKAVEKYKEITAKPETQEVLNKAKMTAGEAAENIKAAYDKAIENVNIGDTFKGAVEKGKELIGQAQEKYKEFTHNPKVRSTVRGAVDTLGEAVNTAVNTVKGVFKPETKEECECDGECNCEGECECHCDEKCCCSQENKTEE